MTTPALRFDGVTKSYGSTAVLHGVSFEIGRGDFFGLVGINGAGKTTLLKCLLDFCTFNGGAIEIFGVAHDAPGARSRLAFLPERLNPPYYLTGEDFIRYTLDMQAAPYDRGEAERMMRALDLDIAATHGVADDDEIWLQPLKPCGIVAFVQFDTGFRQHVAHRRINA